MDSNIESEEFKEITNKALDDYSPLKLKLEDLLPAVTKHNGDVQQALYQLATKNDWLKYYDILKIFEIRKERLIRPSVPDYLILYVILKGIEKRDVQSELSKLPVFNEEEAFYVRRMAELTKKYPNTIRALWSDRALALIKNKGNLYYTTSELFDGEDWVDFHKNHLTSQFENYGVNMPAVEEVHSKIKATRGNFDVLMREYLSLEQIMQYHMAKIDQYREEYSIKESVSDDEIMDLIEIANGDLHSAMREVPTNNDIPSTIPLNQPRDDKHEWSELIAHLPNSCTNHFDSLFSRVEEQLRDQYKCDNCSQEEILDAYVGCFLEKVALKDAFEALANGEKKPNPRSENAKVIVQRLKKTYGSMINFCNKLEFYIAAQMSPEDDDMIISLTYTGFK